MVRWLAVAAVLAGCEPRVTFDREAVEALRLGRALPRGFKLGVATSAHQVEGGTVNDWTRFEATVLPDGGRPVREPSGRACDSWNRWPEDHAALEWLGVNTYRLSIEWSRLEPEEGAWDAAAAARYRERLESLRRRGIEPVVAVSHFTLPLWVADRGGWEWNGLPAAHGRFARRLGELYGDLVDTWITVNEPNAVALGGYAAGIWPPGVQDVDRAWRVYAGTLRVHAGISRGLREGDRVDADGDGRATFIGIAHNITLFQAGTGGVMDSMFAAAADDVFNEMVPRAIKTGRIHFGLPGTTPVDEAAPELVGSMDFLGIQYYRREMLRADLFNGGYGSSAPSGGTLSDDDRELFPEGLYRLLVRFQHYGWPLMVTENGLADRYDVNREWAVRGHLYAVVKALEDGVPVLGYLHWSLMDNWEWAQGTSARYGLFEVDFTDPGLPRTPRPSAQVFRQIAHDLAERPRTE